MTKTRKTFALARLGAVAVAAMAVSGGVFVAPTSAATTTICLDSHIVGTKGGGSLTCSAGGAYGTDVATADTTTGTLDGTINGGKSTFSSGFVTVNCTSATLTGSSLSTGGSQVFSTFSFSGCTDQFGATVTVTAHSLNTWGGSSAYNMGGTGKDGTMTVNGPSGTYMWSLTDAGTTCNYSPGGTAGGGSFTGDLWDVGNTQTGHPFPAGKGGVNFSNVTMTLFSGGFACSNSGTFTGAFDLTGNNPAGVNIGITS